MTLTELFNYIYPYALKCGISIFDFWNYTYGEIVDLLNAYKEIKEERTKEQIVNNYQIAVLTAVFTNKANNGKQPPSLYELYPDLFVDEQLAEEQTDNSWIFYKEQMIDYANEHNRREVIKQ